MIFFRFIFSLVLVLTLVFGATPSVNTVYASEGQDAPPGHAPSNDTAPDQTPQDQQESQQEAQEDAPAAPVPAPSAPTPSPAVTAALAQVEAARGAFNAAVAAAGLNSLGGKTTADGIVAAVEARGALDSAIAAHAAAVSAAAQSAAAVGAKDQGPAGSVSSGASGGNSKGGGNPSNNNDVHQGGVGMLNKNMFAFVSAQTSASANDLVNTITATGCVISTGGSSCDASFSWDVESSLKGTVELFLTPPTGDEYNWSESRAAWKDGAPAVIKSVVTTKINTPGIWIAQLRDRETGKLLAITSFDVITKKASIDLDKSGIISATSCTIPAGGVSCDSVLDWSTAGTENGKVDIMLIPPGGVEYNWSRLNKAWLKGAPGTLRTTATYFTVPGTWIVKVYEHGTKNLLTLTSIQVRGEAGAPIDLSASACKIGQKSTLIPDNSLVCDSKVSWSAPAYDTAYVVITGDFPYNEERFPYGYVAGQGLTVEDAKFWTVAGNYKASLYLNGVPPTLTEPGTGTRFKEVKFSVAGNPATGDGAVCTTSRLNSGKTLTPGQTLKSCNGKHTLTFTTDGNLALRASDSTTPVWTSDTTGSGATTLSMQNDGNLVLYTKSRKAVWSLLSYTGGKMGKGQYLELKDDGTLAVYNQKGEARWDSRMMLKKSSPVATTTTGTISVITPCTVGVGKSVTDPKNAVICDQTIAWTTQNAKNVKLVITGDFPYNTANFPQGYTLSSSTQNSAALWVTAGTYKATLYNGTTKLAERSFTVKPPTPPTPCGNGLGCVPTTPTTCGKLLPGKSLTPGQSITSCNGAHTATFGTDGNFTFGAWNSRTSGQSATRLSMQTDGNLVIYAGSRALWSVLSHTGGKMGTGQYLELKDDGTLAVYNAAGAVRWSTTMPFKTVTPPTPTPTTTPTITGTITTPTPCVVGVGKSVTDLNNAVICDQTIAWTTSNNPTGAKLVITGAFPYDTANFASGYTAGTGPQGSVAFWVTSGTYKATLYNGTTKLDEKTFTVAPAVLTPAATTTSEKSKLNQMASVLEALRALLGGWR